MKMKSIIAILFLVVIIGLSVFFLFEKVRQKEQKQEVYLSIPEFQLLDIYGNRITNKNLKQETVMFLFFNPDCDLCEEEIRQIQVYQADFSQSQIVFFSPVSTNVILRFLQKINFTPTQNILFLSDENEFLTDKMDVKTTPAVYIYRKGKLIKRFDGSVKIETLIRYLSTE